MMLYRSQMSSHLNRAKWARSASTLLAAELPLLDDLVGRELEMCPAANMDSALYDDDLFQARLDASERRESLITQAVVNGAAAIEGAYHGLAIAALGADYANKLTRVPGMAWRWRLLIRILWGADLSLGEPPLRGVNLLFESRNWLMHPSVVEIHTGAGSWRELNFEGEVVYEPVDLSEFADKVNAGWEAARHAALGIERTFTELADCVDGFEPSAGIRFELIQT